MSPALDGPEVPAFRPYGVGVKEGDTDLQGRITDAIRQMIDDGRLRPRNDDSRQ